MPPLNALEYYVQGTPFPEKPLRFHPQLLMQQKQPVDICLLVFTVFSDTVFSHAHPPH